MDAHMVLLCSGMLLKMSQELWVTAECARVILRAIGLWCVSGVALAVTECVEGGLSLPWLQRPCSIFARPVLALASGFDPVRLGVAARVLGHPLGGRRLQLVLLATQLLLSGLVIYYGWSRGQRLGSVFGVPQFEYGHTPGGRHVNRSLLKYLSCDEYRGVAFCTSSVSTVADFHVGSQYSSCMRRLWLMSPSPRSMGLFSVLRFLSFSGALSGFGTLGFPGPARKGAKYSGSEANLEIS
eukprot:6491855-Amphidinium_carterae.2